MFSQNWRTEEAMDFATKNGPFINILLLGETGVGKSTFINSIANYLTHSDFQKAEKEELLALIPLKYTVQDKNGKYHTIQIDPKGDQNECLDTGMSATQEVRSYVFPIKNGAIRIRLIDTPGIGDVRGIDQDNTNCENILNYIAQFDKLHAICCLFKPTHSRITVYFDYCLTQMLSRLEKSASKNIIFIFTNTRGTHYSPGDTLPNLEKIIEGIKSKHQVDIPLNGNLFCFDNEAFRYLVSTKRNIQLDDFVRQRNSESWDRSAKQCKNLINYIIGDHENLPLEPHFIENTSTVNEVRRLIIQFSKLLSETSQLIADNLSASERHTEELDLESHRLNELKQKLYTPVTDVLVTKSNEPVVVCASAKCTEVYKVGDIKKRYYKQVCQNPCYLSMYCSEIIGHPELLNCGSIDYLTKTCKMCNCDFSSHMQTYYITKTVELKMVDYDVQKDINSKEKLLENTKELVMKYQKENNELEVEYNVLVKICNRFANFLKYNVIVPFSDSYKEYMEYLIMQEKSLGVSSSKSVVQHLQKLLKEYEPMKQFFSETLSSQKNTGKEDTSITYQNIHQILQKMCELKCNGKKIKEFRECQRASSRKKYKHTEYVHDILQFGDSWNKKDRENVTKNTNQNKTQQRRPFYNSRGEFIIHDIERDRRQRRKDQSDIQYPRESSVDDLNSGDSTDNQSQTTSIEEGQWQTQDSATDILEFQNEGNDQSAKRSKPRSWMRGRGRGQWQNRYKVRNLSQTRPRARSQGRTEGRRREQSQSPDKENDQLQARSRPRGRIRDRDQWQNEYQGRRDRSKSQNRESCQSQIEFQMENQSQIGNNRKFDSPNQDQGSDQPKTRIRQRGRGRGQWQNKYNVRNQSQTRSRARSQGRTEDRRREQSQSPDKETDQFQPRSRPRGRTRDRDQWQNEYQGRRDRSKSQNRESGQSQIGFQTENQLQIRNNRKFDSPNQDQESDQPKTRIRMRGRGRGQWQNRNGQQSHSKPRTENNRRDQSQPQDGEGEQSQTSFTPRGQSRGRGRGRGRWQGRYRGRNQSRPRAKSQTRIDQEIGQSEKRSQTPTHNGRNELQFQNKENNQSRFQHGGGIQNTYKEKNPSEIQTKNSEQSYSKPSDYAQSQKYPDRGAEWFKSSAVKNQTAVSTIAKDLSQNLTVRATNQGSGCYVRSTEGPLINRQLEQRGTVIQNNVSTLNKGISHHNRYFEVGQEVNPDFGRTIVRNSFTTSRNVISPQHYQLRSQSYHQAQTSKKSDKCCIL